MQRIIKSYEFAEPPAQLRQIWDEIHHGAELRGSLDAAFEPLAEGGTRLRVATAWEADGERRIESAVARVKRALGQG